MVLRLPYCLECEGSVSTDYNQVYLYLAVTNEEERLPEMKCYYHIDCFLKILKKSKFRDEIETEVVFKKLQLGARKCSSGPVCEICNKAVTVSSEESYVYFLLSFGMPGSERYGFFHRNCFPKILRKRTKLFSKKEDKEEIIFT